MPTPPKGPRLGGSPAHERLILANLARSLFEHGRITTTLTKAKRLRPVAEKLITSAKRGTLHARREVLKTIRDKDVLHKLFAEIGPSFATREGGYTRITKIMPRKGDNAPMAVIELIGEETVSSAASRVARTAASRKKAAPATAEAPTTAESKEAVAGEEISEAAGEVVADDSAAGDTEVSAAEEVTSDAAEEVADEPAAEPADETATEDVEEAADEIAGDDASEDDEK